MIVGIDEVGRGAWAGPLVVGAVCLNGVEIAGLTDSKALTRTQREKICDEILQSQAVVGLGWVHAEEIDAIGLSEALRVATKRAVQQVQSQHISFHEVIIDGTINFLENTPLERYVTTIKKADLLIPSVSAASIVAKVTRDAWMAEQDTYFDGYEFASHVGYGTAKHRARIQRYGVTKLHRLSIAPLKQYASVAESMGDKNNRDDVTTTRIGELAETVGCMELERRGHTILDRNWKTKYCEIDIISRKDDVLYFVEVKHRRTRESGDGLAAITNKKHRQMRFAAELYLQQYPEAAAMLAVITTSGTPPVFELYLEIE